MIYQVGAQLLPNPYPGEIMLLLISFSLTNLISLVSQKEVRSYYTRATAQT